MISNELSKYLHQSLKELDLDNETIDIMTAGWRPGTVTQYSVYLRKWDLFCRDHNILSSKPSTRDLLQFLTGLFRTGAGYSALNTARSALSSVITLDGTPCGEHKLIRRFMRGAFNLRPSLPRYCVTWDVDILFSYLRATGQVSCEINLKELTLRTVCLAAILSGQRVQTLHQLKLTGMLLSNDHCVFYIDSILKQSRPGKHLSTLEFQAYSESSLCIIAHLKVYLEKTKNLRGSSDKLFISYQKPFRPVSKETIARWIKTILAKAGVDIRIFKAHSTRSASASKANNCGMPVSEILQKIGWSNEETFARFYKKQIGNQGNIGQTLLTFFGKKE